MEREIVLSSYSVKGQGNNTPQDFTTKFNRPLILDRIFTIYSWTEPNR